MKYIIQGTNGKDSNELDIMVDIESGPTDDEVTLAFEDYVEKTDWRFSLAELKLLLRYAEEYITIE